MPSKAQRIKKSKNMLKDINKRLDMVTVAMDTFNTTTDIQELYTSIKHNMVDPICYDAVGPPARNKYCVLSGVTLSQCTRTLLKILRDIVPLFHAIGMPVSYAEIKSIRREKEKYDRLCGLFAEGQRVVDSLPRIKKKIERKPTELDVSIGKAVDDVDPDFKHTISILIRRMHETGQSEGAIIAEFVKDAQARIQKGQKGQKGQKRQKAGGYGDDHRYGSRYDDEEYDRRGFDYQPRSPGYAPSGPAYAPPGPAYAPPGQAYAPPLGPPPAPGQAYAPPRPPPLGPPTVPPPGPAFTADAEAERRRLIQRIQTLKSEYNQHHLKIWSEQDRRYQGLIKKADTLKTRIEDRIATIEASLEWTEIYSIGGVVGNSLLLAIAGGLAYTMYSYNAMIVELERKREQVAESGAPFCWSNAYGAMMKCDDPLYAASEQSTKIPSFYKASTQFIKDNPLVMAGLLTLQVTFLIIRYRTILNERRAAAPAHIDMLTDMLGHLEIYKDRLKGMGYCVPPKEPDGFMKCPPKAGVHNLHNIVDDEARAECEELGCTWGNSIDMINSLQYHLGSLGKHISTLETMNDYAVVTDLDVTINTYEGILMQIRNVSHGNVQESVDQLHAIEKSFNDMKYRLLSFSLLGYIQSPHVALTLWACYTMLSAHHDEKVAEAIIQNNLSQLFLTTGVSLVTGNLLEAVDGVAQIQGAHLDYERNRAQIQARMRNEIFNNVANAAVQGDQFQIGIPRDAFGHDQRAAERYHEVRTRAVGQWRRLARDAIPHVQQYWTAAAAVPRTRAGAPAPANQDLNAAPPEGAMERIVAQEATIARLQDRIAQLEAETGPRTPDPRFDDHPGYM